jgi:hypothetical protein
MGDYSWTINGCEITDGIDVLGEIDLTISETTDKEAKDELKKAVINTLKAQKGSKNGVEKVTLIKRFNVAFKGALPFTGTLKLHISTKYKNKKVFLSRYDKKIKKVVPECYSLVDSDGNAVFTFSQASTYIVSLENPVLPAVIARKTLKVGKSYMLKVKNILQGAEISFSSDKKSVAAVDKDGKITAKKAGVATITTNVKQSGKTYNYKTKITVKEK